MAKNSISYKVDNGDSLVVSVKRVIEKMETNPAFPNPPAALATLIQVLPEFEEALVKSKGRDMEMVSIKNDKKEIVLDLLKQLKDYVLSTSNGDRTMILSSGFETAPSDNASMPAPSIGSLTVTIGNPGEATTLLKDIVGTKAYIHQYATEPPGPNTIWISEGSSQRTFTFTGLTSDKRYWFRGVAIGHNGLRAFSPVVSRSIQ